MPQNEVYVWYIIFETCAMNQIQNNRLDTNCHFQKFSKDKNIYLLSLMSVLLLN
jgi:hypothetical protein